LRGGISRGRLKEREKKEGREGRMNEWIVEVSGGGGREGVKDWVRAGVIIRTHDRQRIIQS
jgi:hypothetical protein